MYTNVVSPLLKLYTSDPEIRMCPWHGDVRFIIVDLFEASTIHPGIGLLQFKQSAGAYPSSALPLTRSSITETFPSHFHLVIEWIIVPMKHQDELLFLTIVRTSSSMSACSSPTF